MTKLESEIVEINKSSQEIFDFLSDFNRFEKLMPHQVIDWSCTIDECTFTIKGMATLGLKMESKIPNSEVVMKSSGKAPFPFTITSAIIDQGESSKVKLTLDAELNPFLKMMAEKPLTNFLNLLLTKLKEI